MGKKTPKNLKKLVSTTQNLAVRAKNRAKVKRLFEKNSEKKKELNHVFSH